MPKENIFSGKYEPDRDTCTEAYESNVARFRTAMLDLIKMDINVIITSSGQKKR